MIDAFTCFTQSCVSQKKDPKLIVDNLVLHWVGIFGTPVKIWTDVENLLIKK